MNHIDIDTKETILEHKKQLRKEIKNKRSLLTKEMIQKESENALIQLLKTKEYQMALSIFTYVSYQQELSTFPLIQAAFLDGKIVAVPKVRKEQEMEFFKIKEYSELSPGFCGILEPNGTKEQLYPDKNSMIILPGMLFDLTGKRLGYGGGFYDHYLKKFIKQKNTPILAGFAYDFQIFENKKKENDILFSFLEGNFPAEPHDQSVDMIITPTRVIYSQRKKDGYD